jgi:hypothetical protein
MAWKIIFGETDLNPEERSGRRWGIAWFGLCVAFALHVIDEATNDFLAFYNPTVIAIKGELPWLPLPIFEFMTWISVLSVALILLFSLTVFAYNRSSWMRAPSYLFAVVMLLNGVGHIGGSIFRGELIPGVYSSPLLIIASIYLIYSVRKDTLQEI